MAQVTFDGPIGLDEIPEALRPKAQVIYQSAEPLPEMESVAAHGAETRADAFTVGVIGHLRPEKDPLRTALAVRRLPTESRLEVIHVGRALDIDMEESARDESARNPRYRWLGELPHERTRRLLTACNLLSLTSTMEGSSNVLSEALASSLPVISSRIPGIIGTLGEDYPGYFPVGNTDALAVLLHRAETDHEFYTELKSHCERASALVRPERESEAWRELLEELRT